MFYSGDEIYGDDVTSGSSYDDDDYFYCECECGCGNEVDEDYIICDDCEGECV